MGEKGSCPLPKLPQNNMCRMQRKHVDFLCLLALTTLKGELKRCWLEWVVFPAISDVASTVKCEAFKDLHSPSQSPPPPNYKPPTPPFLLLRTHRCWKYLQDTELKLSRLQCATFLSVTTLCIHSLDQRAQLRVLVASFSSFIRALWDEFLVFSLSL